MSSESLPPFQSDAVPLSRATQITRWLTTADHKRLGILYIVFGLVFLVMGGTEAAVMRIQLIRPDNNFVSPEVFNRMFTMHGTTMIFFVAMPMVFGFANYFIPLMIGARDMAFPRLNAFSFWVMAFGGVILYSSFLAGDGLLQAGSAPDVGWFAYAPLTARAFSPGHSADFWTLGLLVSGVGSIGTAINIITTILVMRCPGMTLGRMPLFAWLNLVMGGLVILAMGPLTAAQIMLLIDRYLGGHFFDTTAGGSAVLWMHFFWIFGHPEVYVLVLPAFAIASEVIPVFSRKVIFGYPIMVGATVAIGFIGMSVWAHHMFAVGMSSNANTFFVLTTMAISVPTGIKIFNWLATMWGGSIHFKTPMLFCIGFLFQFLIAGLTGVMMASAPFDWQLTGSYFVVAHFHYVIVGSILFCIFAAFYYWFPKMSGRMLSERLGKWHFWLFFIGFHLTFDFMFIPGLLGMPRRIYTYEPSRGWWIWNIIETIGVPVQASAIALFAINLLSSLFRGKRAGNDPWDAWTLEWATSSPPPVYNFSSIPLVRSRRPLWDLKHPNDPDSTCEPDEPLDSVKPEVDTVVAIPANTAAPIALALGVALLAGGLLATAYLSIVGIVFLLFASIIWFRDILPREKHELIATVPAEPVSTQRVKITQIHSITGHQHRARLPVAIHPVSAGAKGGIAGAAALAAMALLWSELTHHGIWYPVNVLAASFFPQRVTTAQLMAFHWDALIAGVAILVFGTALVGLLYGAALPMVPRHPISVATVAMPLIGWALAHSILATVNPVFRERIDWPWFILSLAVFGIIAGTVVSRAERIRVWQHFPLAERAGVEVGQQIDESGDAHD
ncbi:MAG: cytochrome c oxidase subunit I [Terracidiphilus sp.]